VIAHNLTRWACLLGDQPTVTSVTFRTRITAIPAVAVNRSGRPTLRLPRQWPWADTFTSMLTAMRALPGPAG
jgi:hypothetical protein